MMERGQDTRTWPELAVGLYDQLTGRNAQITYEFRDMSVGVPSGTGDSATHAQWKINGTISIHTKERSEG
jgi:hypothetical protein